MIENISNIVLLNDSIVPPGFASAPYAECGLNYCVPQTVCVDAIRAATRLHYLIEIGFIIVAVCMILFCEFYRRKAKKLETQLKEQQEGGTTQ